MLSEIGTSWNVNFPLPKGLPFETQQAASTSLGPINDPLNSQPDYLLKVSAPA